VLGVLSLGGWAAVAQYVFTLTTIGALGTAAWQLRQNAANAARDRTHVYVDRVTSRESLDEWHDLKAYWRFSGYTDFRRLPGRQQVEMLRLPNLLDEVGSVYNKGGLDRDLASELLGVYVEVLWESGKQFILDMRSIDQRNKVFDEWGRMQADTQARRENPLGEREDPGGPSVIRWALSAQYRRANHKVRWW
jgi:hypothetical protein